MPALALPVMYILWYMSYTLSNMLYMLLIMYRIRVHRDKETLGKSSFGSAKSGGGKEFLLLYYRAKA